MMHSLHENLPSSSDGDMIIILYAIHYLKSDYNIFILSSR